MHSCRHADVSPDVESTAGPEKSYAEISTIVWFCGRRRCSWANGRDEPAEGRKLTADEDTVILTARRLAVESTEQEHRPARYRKQTASKQKSQKVKDKAEMAK